MSRKKIFSLKERKKIEDLLRSETSARDIALILDTWVGDILNEIQKGGGRTGYTAMQGQQVAEIAKAPNRKALQEIHNLKERIDCFEMQLEIVLIELKELKNAKNK